YDGDAIRFTHTTRRAKYRNLQANPSMSLAVADPAHPEQYLEVRGRLVDVVPDPDGAFYVHLGRRYGEPDTEAPPDKADRVILVISIEHSSPRRAPRARPSSYRCWSRPPSRSSRRSVPAASPRPPRSGSSGRTVGCTSASSRVARS